MTSEGVPLFPNARYMLHCDEWDFYQFPALKMSIAPHIDRMLTPLKKLGMLELLAAGSWALPEEGVNHPWNFLRSRIVCI